MQQHTKRLLCIFLCASVGVSISLEASPILQPSFEQPENIFQVLSGKGASSTNKPSAATQIAALINRQEFDLAEKKYKVLAGTAILSALDYAIVTQAYLNTNKIGLAQRVGQQGLEHHLHSPHLLYLSAQTYERRGQYESALIYYQQAAIANQQLVMIKEGALNERIANLHLKLKQLPEAYQQFKSKSDGEIITQTEVMSAVLYHASELNFSGALSVLDKHLGSNPSLYIVKVQLLLLDQKPRQALKLIQTLNSVSNSQATNSVVLLSALAELQLDNPENALAVLSRYTSTNKSGSVALSEATVHMALGDTKKAVVAISRAPMPFPEITSYPSLTDHLQSPELGKVLGLAFFSLDRGLYKVTEKLLQPALINHPSNLFLNFLLAETYRRDGRHEEALIAIKKLTEAMPESFFFRFQLAQAYQQMGKHSIALKLFKTLSEDRPDFVMTQLAYAKSLTNANRLTEAREVLEWSLNFKPGSTTLLATLGWTLVELKDYEALNELIDRLKNTSSVPPSIATHLAGWSAFQRNQLPQAVELLSQAMQLSPGNPELCYHLGKTLLANKQTRRGVNLLRQAMFFPETNDKYFEEVEGLIQ